MGVGQGAWLPSGISFEELLVKERGEEETMENEGFGMGLEEGSRQRDWAVSKREKMC